MLRRRGASRLTCAVALALIATACSSTNADPQDKPVPGGTLRVAVRDLATLDPAHASGRGALFVVAQLFDSLTAIDPATGDAVAAAATKWETSNDGKTWTFHLPTTARFHDGPTVTAGDFKLAFDRIAARKTNSDAAFQLESVRGFRESRVLGTAPMLSGVTIVNSSTLRITLDKPFAELAVFLAHPALAPLPHGAFRRNEKGFPNNPVGNGPFKMAAARKANEVELVRNETYTGARALLDKLVVHLYGGAEDAWRGYLNGNQDVAEVPASALASGAGKFGTGGFTPFWAAVYYGANIRNPKLSKQIVRQAISLAIDRVKIARNVYGGTKTPATGMVPRGVAGYQPDRCGSCEHDVERAKGLIRTAFGGKRQTITIDHLDASPSREVARAIGADLQAVGLGVAYRAHTSQKYLVLLQSGGHELAELGWLAEVPSPDGFLAQQLRTKSPNNQTGFSGTVVDGLIDRARAEEDRTQRLDLYRQAEVEALQRMPLIPIVFFRNHIAIAEKVRDLHIDGAGLFDASKVWIAQSR
jgi:peptide/nickel transport system substrate-binding protein/oligopeptide transport system substrate-binding protein